MKSARAGALALTYPWIYCLWGLTRAEAQEAAERRTLAGIGLGRRPYNRRAESLMCGRYRLSRRKQLIEEYFATADSRSVG